MRHCGLGRSRWIVAALLCTAIVVGCRQFSLYEQYPSDHRTSSTGPTISPSSAVVTTNTRLTFAASGGRAPYRFAVVSGGGSIGDTSGVYLAPSTAGTATVRVIDDGGNTAASSVTILAITPSSQLAVSPGVVSMIAGTTLSFAASGGSPPYLFAVAGGGGSIDATTGLYQAPSAPGSATVTLTDSSLGAVSAAVQVVAAGSGTAINPVSATVAPNSTLSFAGSGGTPPYSFSIVSGGGAVDAVSGAYHAPGTAGTTTVRVSDALSATRDATVTVLPPPSSVAISPVSPAVTVGAVVNFTAGGGIPPYTYSLLPGGAGGSIGPATGVYDAPTAPGSDVVRVTDAAGGISDATVTVVAATRLVISPPVLTIAVGNTYRFGATGGVPPYSFSLYSGGASVSPGGLYTAPGASSTATVRVTDSANETSDAIVSVVPGGLLAISPASAAVPEGGTVAFTGSGGTPAYTFTVSGAGSIGVYSGIFTATGAVATAAATVKMTDSASLSVSATVDIVPAAPSGLTATGAGPHTIELAWTNNTASAETVIVERRPASGGSYSAIATLSPSETTYSDTNPTNPPNTLYVYRIRATAGSGALLSPYSNEAYGLTTG